MFQFILATPKLVEDMGGWGLLLLLFLLMSLFGGGKRRNYNSTGNDVRDRFNREGNLKK